MDDINSLLFGGGAATVRAERLTALRAQRMRLEALIGELGAAAAQFRASAEGERDRAWRSHAGRVYAARRGELQEELDRAATLVHTALSSVERAIHELRAAE